MDRAARLTMVNLFGPPGVGKSATRSGVFWLMKTHHLSVEEVSEYAKYLVLSGREWQLRDEQLYLFAKQHHKQLILRGQYRYGVTDSPLVLAPFYSPKNYLPGFFAMARDAWAEFDNVNFYLTRDLANDTFEDVGRVHGREQSIRVDGEMREYLAREGITYREMPLDPLTPWRIVEALQPGLVRFPRFED